MAPPKRVRRRTAARIRKKTAPAVCQDPKSPENRIGKAMLNFVGMGKEPVAPG